MEDQLWLEDMGGHYRDMTKADLVEASTRKPIRRLLQADVHGLCEEGLQILAEPVLELRVSNAPMRLQIAEGVSHGEALFYLAEMRKMIVQDWGRLGSDACVFRPHPGRHSDEIGGEEVAP